MIGTSKNHIMVRSSGELFELRLSRELRAALGEPVRFRFKDPGSEIARGAPFGRAEGVEQSCHLHAPFALVVEEAEAELIQCRRVSADGDPLLDSARYQQYFSTEIPR